ncbi:MAG TPA: type VI secretion system tube protein Hcp [Vicinamibacterales bacterium]|nr:type VI secretion system tube protein Hcp [Vicinamibacterales bacterium]
MDAIFLDIPDIKGQSTIKGFEDKIEVLSASHGVAMQITASPSATERTSGKPNHQDLTVSKYVDLSTCPMIAACNAGTNLKTVTMTIGRNDSGTILPYLVFTMDNTIVSSVSVSSGGGDRPTETVTLNYSKIKWDYTEQQVGTGKKGNNGAIWDLATNQPS